MNMANLHFFCSVESLFVCVFCFNHIDGEMFAVVVEGLRAIHTKNDNYNNNFNNNDVSILTDER